MRGVGAPRGVLRRSAFFFRIALRVEIDGDLSSKESVVPSPLPLQMHHPPKILSNQIPVFMTFPFFPLVPLRSSISHAKGA